HHLGCAALWAGDLPQARRQFEESLPLQRGLGQESRTGWTLLYLGQVEYHAGDLVGAAALCRRSLTLGRQNAEQWLIALSLFQLALVALRQADRHQARSHLMAA